MAPSVSLSISVLSELVSLELVTAVAAMVGFATCSMNSSKLGVSSMFSGTEAIMADSESTPLFVGAGEVAGARDSANDSVNLPGAQVALFCSLLGLLLPWVSDWVLWMGRRGSGDNFGLGTLSGGQVPFWTMDL